MNKAVLGAAGFLGLNLVDALVAQGERPRCVRRVRTNVLALRQRKVPMAHADLDRRDELDLALKGISTVFHLAGYYPRHSTDREGAIATGLRQLQNVLDAAAHSKVKRLIYVSSTATVAAAPEGPSSEAHVFPEAPKFGTYHELKWRMEQRALEEKRFEVRVVCPSACLGPWDLRVGTSALMVGTARGMNPPHPDGLVSWVDARDVATAVVRLGELENAPRRVVLNAGTVRLQPLLESLARRYGVAPPSPPLTAEQAIAFADAEEANAEKTGQRAKLSREIADLIIHGVPIDASLARRTLGFSPRALEQTLDDFDAWARRVGILPPTPKKEPEWTPPSISTSAS